MKPDDHWFSSYFAQDHAGNLVDILIKISEVTLKDKPKEKGELKKDVRRFDTRKD